MVKLGLELKEDDGKINIKLIDPTKKQLDTATENEKITAQLIKDVLDTRLLEILEENQKENN